MSFWKTYKELCTKSGKSASAVAIGLGMSRGIASCWSQGAVPKAETIVKIAEYFNVDPSVFIDEDEEENKRKPLTSQSLGALVLMPVIGYVKAGLGSAAEEVYTGEYEPVPVDKLHNNPQEFSVLECSGDSMLPIIQPNDRLICHRQNVAENGDLVVAILESGESTVKKFHVCDDGSLELVAFNPYYPPIKLKEGDFIWGKVTSLQRNF